MAALREVHDGFLDLVLGASCVGCRRPGRALCPGCAADLPTTATPSWPTPTPPGLAPPFAAGPYDGVLKAMVVAHKERRVLGLRTPLAALLARAVAAAVDDLAPDVPILLVPVPSRAAAVRLRGHDATADVARGAARALRRTGRTVDAVRLLRMRPGIADQAGLDAGERAANLIGALAVRPAALRRQAARQPAHVVLCDDVITTGASLREAQRALESYGVPVLAAATVAATRRRHAGRTPGVSRPEFGPPLLPGPSTD